MSVLILLVSEDVFVVVRMRLGGGGGMWGVGGGGNFVLVGGGGGGEFIVDVFYSCDDGRVWCRILLLFWLGMFLFFWCNCLCISCVFWNGCFSVCLVLF